MHYVHNYGRWTLRIDEVIEASDISDHHHYVHATVIKGGTTDRMLHHTSYTEDVGRTIEFIATTRELKNGYKDACVF